MTNVVSRNLNTYNGEGMLSVCFCGEFENIISIIKYNTAISLARLHPESEMMMTVRGESELILKSHLNEYVSENQ